MQPATEMRRAVAKGKPALDRSSGVTRASTARASGPISDSTAWAEVTSLTRQSPRRLRAIQSRSWVTKPVPVVM